MLIGSTLLALWFAAVDGTLMVLSPPQPCNGTQYDSWQGNPYGRTVYIVGGYVWQGAAREIKADIGFQLYVHQNATTPAKEIRVGMWDHYAEPTGAEDNISHIHLGGHYFVLEPTGSLLLRHGCALVGPQSQTPIWAGPVHGWLAPFDYYYNLGGHHQQAFLYYSFERPQ